MEIKSLKKTPLSDLLGEYVLQDNLWTVKPTAKGKFFITIGKINCPPTATREVDAVEALRRVTSKIIGGYSQVVYVGGADEKASICLDDLYQNSQNKNGLLNWLKTN